jgi:hypothetical protein
MTRRSAGDAADGLMMVVDGIWIEHVTHAMSTMRPAATSFETMVDHNSCADKLYRMSLNRKALRCTNTSVHAALNKCICSTAFAMWSCWNCKPGVGSTPLHSFAMSGELALDL